MCIEGRCCISLRSGPCAGRGFQGCQVVCAAGDPEGEVVNRMGEVNLVQRAVVLQFCGPGFFCDGVLVGVVGLEWGSSSLVVEV